MIETWKARRDSTIGKYPNDTDKQKNLNLEVCWRGMDAGGAAMNPMIVLTGPTSVVPSACVRWQLQHFADAAVRHKQQLSPHFPSSERANRVV